MIRFNVASITDVEKKYISDALARPGLCGDGFYTKAVHKQFEARFGIGHMLLTTSCSHALDMSALLLGLQPGDEVIVPSYTFVSTANAVLLRGARPRFVDIEPRTMNMDAALIEPLINDHTRAIYPVHYAGVCCDMDAIGALAKKHSLAVVEDAAQAVGSTFRGRVAGTMSDLGCYSFHETKNYVMGEGGALLINNEKYIKQAEILREKGTDRSRFIRGEVDKYTWQSAGSSFLPSDVLAAMLYGQMERYEEIMARRMAVWNSYHERFAALEASGMVRRPFVPEGRTHNAHMYYIILPEAETRGDIMQKARERGVQTVFHYVPLHTSPVGQSLGCRAGDLPMTEDLSARLLRLPLHACMEPDDAAQAADIVIECIKETANARK